MTDEERARAAAAEIGHIGLRDVTRQIVLQALRAVREDEREANAKICDAHGDDPDHRRRPSGFMARVLAREIRARGEREEGGM